MLKLIIAISRWSDQADWRSWIMHGLLAIPLTFLFGAFATSVFYGLRELEQLAHEKMAGAKPKTKDHVYDWIVPTFVAGVVQWLFL